MSDIMIFDTHGKNRIHRRFRERLNHVTFHGITPDADWGDTNNVHGHGGWCAWDILSQSRKSANCMFVRMFDGAGRAPQIKERAGESWWFDYIRSERPKYVNMSWGAHPTNEFSEMALDSRYDDRWLDNFLNLLEDVQCDIFFAAGNDGTAEESYPQIKLAGKHPRIHVVGACDANGTPAVFSGSADGRQRYADVMYLGVKSASLDARNGNAVVWNGTSSACPHAVGDAWARDLGGQELKDYWRTHVLNDSNLDGYSDGVAPAFAGFIKGGGFHPKAGVGCAELSRQENMRRTKLGLSSVISDDHGIKIAEIAPMYHDFARIG